MENRLQNREFGAPQRRRKAASPAKIFFERLIILVVMLALLALIGVIYYTNTSLQRNIDETGKKIATAESDIRRLDREIKAMENEQAKYSDWVYIKERISYYNLGLIPAPVQQQERLVIKRTLNPAQSSTVQTAGR